MQVFDLNNWPNHQAHDTAAGTSINIKVTKQTFLKKEVAQIVVL